MIENKYGFEDWIYRSNTSLSYIIKSINFKYSSYVLKYVNYKNE